MLNRARIKLLLIMLIAILSTVIITIYTSPDPKKRVDNTKKIEANFYNGTWLWDTNYIVNKKQKIITYIKNNNLSTLYLQIDDDIEMHKYREFIKLASNNDIKVYALGGEPDWTSDRAINQQRKFYNWVREYQGEANNEEEFKGISLDIESYLADNWKDQRQLVILRLQDSILYGRNQAEELDIPLNVAIPFWFDSEKYSNLYGRGNLAAWVIKSVPETIIMAYRDEARGKNGIIDLIKREFVWAKRFDNDIVIAVELNCQRAGRHISFYDRTYDYMEDQLTEVHNYFKEDGHYKGIAVHDLKALMLANDQKFKFCQKSS